MTILPDWDSVQSTERWSDFLFWAGIACLVLLAATEVASHIYGSRATELRSEAARSAEKRRQEDADAAENRRKAEVGSLQSRLSEVQKQQEPRRLSEAQKQFLISRLSQYRGEKIEFVAMAGDHESIQFAYDFRDVFVAAGWQDVGNGVAQAFIGGTGAVGIEITINQAEAESGHIPPGIQPLVNAFTEAGLLPAAVPGRPNVFMNPQSPADRIVLRIGTKAPPQAADTKVTEPGKENPRRLTQEQRQTLIAALAPYRGQKVVPATILGDPECKRFLQDFLEVFDAAGWDYGHGSRVSYVPVAAGTGPVGVMLLVDVAVAAQKKAPRGMPALMNTLASFGLVPPNFLTPATDLQPEEVGLVIGRKP